MIIRTLWRLSLLMCHLIIGTVLIIYTRLAFGQQWYDTARGMVIIQWWMKQACNILALRITTQGTRSIVKGTLFVANHISWLDIIALSSIAHTRFLSKDSLKYWPLIGWLATSVGTLLIQRDRYFVINKVADAIRATLDKSQSVMLFPEGTTTDGREVGRFYSGLLKSVSQSEYVVQPVAIQYSRDGKADELAPYIGQDTFIFHLARIAGRNETNLVIYFTPALFTRHMTRHDIAQHARQNIVDAIANKGVLTPQQAARLVA